MQLGKFDEEVNGLKKHYHSGCFDYPNGSASFRKIATNHFSGVAVDDKHGIYIVRRKEDQEVLYIGKSGKFNNNTKLFENQDIPKRLINTKNSGKTANEWFKSLLKEKGPLTIEYIFLPVNPISPAFAESLLLQAYLNENGSLPLRNDSF